MTPLEAYLSTDPVTGEAAVERSLLVKEFRRRHPPTGAGSRGGSADMGWSPRAAGLVASGVKAVRPTQPGSEPHNQIGTLSQQLARVMLPPPPPESADEYLFWEFVRLLRARPVLAMLLLSLLTSQGKPR
jgi:hypothetical protein